MTVTVLTDRSRNPFMTVTATHRPVEDEAHVLDEERLALGNGQTHEAVAGTAEELEAEARPVLHLARVDAVGRQVEHQPVVLQHAAQHDTAQQHSTAQHNTAQHYTTQRSTI